MEILKYKNEIFLAILTSYVISISIYVFRIDRTCRCNRVITIDTPTYVKTPIKWTRDDSKFETVKESTNDTVLIQFGNTMYYLLKDILNDSLSNNIRKLREQIYDDLLPADRRGDVVPSVTNKHLKLIYYIIKYILPEEDRRNYPDIDRILRHIRRFINVREPSPMNKPLIEEIVKILRANLYYYL